MPNMKSHGVGCRPRQVRAYSLIARTTAESPTTPPSAENIIGALL